MRRVLAALSIVTTALATFTGVQWATASGPGKPLPSKDPFYRYDGSTPLARIKPGTVLKQRTAELSVGTNGTPVPVVQLLYRTTDERRRPSVTVTTVATPSPAVAVPRVIGYMSFYDALGPECDPSYTLTGGYAGNSANEQQAEVEEGLISAYLAEGDIVTIPDFEGTGLHWGAGQESGYGAIDAIRATEAALHLPPTTPVGMTGYSGGSIAAEWASELAPRYAPELNIVGVAAGGVPVHYAHNLDYVNGSKVWSGVIPAVLVSVGRAFGVDIQGYLDAKGRRITHQVSNECIGSFNGAYPGLTIQSLLKPRYRHFYQQPVFVHIINRLIMGSTPGHPAAPLFLAAGKADGTGDGIIVAGDVEGLAHEYCTQGVAVQFAEYDGDSHTQAAIPFEQTALQFLQQRLDGMPFSGNCASIGKGNSLTPVPEPRHHGRQRHRHTR